MIKTAVVTEEDKILMAQYKIMTETKTVFLSGGYKYDKLKDALDYAVLSAERGPAPTNE